MVVAFAQDGTIIAYSKKSVQHLVNFCYGQRLRSGAEFTLAFWVVLLLLRWCGAAFLLLFWVVTLSSLVVGCCWWCLCSLSFSFLTGVAGFLLLYGWCCFPPRSMSGGASSFGWCCRLPAAFGVVQQAFFSLMGGAAFPSFHVGWCFVLWVVLQASFSFCSGAAGFFLLNGRCCFPLVPGGWCFVLWVVLQASFPFMGGAAGFPSL